MREGRSVHSERKGEKNVCGRERDREECEAGREGGYEVGMVCNTMR